MTIYIVLIMILVLLVMTKSGWVIEFNRKKISVQSVKLFILYLVLLSISGFRYMTGTDYINYKNAFEMIKDGIDVYWLNFESGFMALNAVIGECFGNAQVLIFFAAMITLSFVFLTYKNNSTDAILSVYLFVCLYFYFGSFNYVRQYIAVAMVICAFPDIRKKNLVRYFIKIIFASLFHTTALFMLLFYFIGNLKGKLRIYIPCSIFVILARVLYIPLLGLIVRIVPKYAIYLNYEKGGSIINVATLALNLVLLLSIVKKENYSDIDRKNLTIYCNACFLGLCFYTFAPLNTLFSRLGTYFFVFSTLSLPFYVKFCPLKGKSKNLCKMILCGISALICMYYLYNNNNGVVPYMWYFSK